MQGKILFIALFAIAIILGGCGGGGSSTQDNITTVTLSGYVTYDKVPVSADYIGLDYSRMTRESAKMVQVEAIDGNGASIASASTDTSGFYALNVPSNTLVKIRVSAKMLKTGTPSWNVSVVNNANRSALYVMEGALVSSGTVNSQRNLHAPSGWGGSSYIAERTAAPFAMLDTIYQSMQQVLNVDAGAVFPPLVVNWYAGSVEGTYYTNRNLYIYGDADNDTDEYDDHVIAHEWGHYYEDAFSRTDSIGGDHSEEDILDIRVAFSEGWGNAFSGMALQNPVYFDTYGDAQALGFSFDVESGTSNNKGWYNESSIQRILYDVYDDAQGDDMLDLGFSSIHRVLTGAQKTTPAFTSIFTFITALKSENAGDAEDIDTLVLSENIAAITDIYGLGRVNKAEDYPYYTLSIGVDLPIRIDTKYGTYNALNNRKYIKFTVASAKTYTIKVQQTNGSNADPDFALFRTAPFAQLAISESEVAGSEQNSFVLSAGTYLLDVSEYKNLDDVQLNVSVN